MKLSEKITSDALPVVIAAKKLAEDCSITFEQAISAIEIANQTRGTEKFCEKVDNQIEMSYKALAILDLIKTKFPDFFPDSDTGDLEQFTKGAGFPTSEVFNFIVYGKEVKIRVKPNDSIGELAAHALLMEGISKPLSDFLISWHPLEKIPVSQTILDPAKMFCEYRMCALDRIIITLKAGTGG